MTYLQPYISLCAFRLCTFELLKVNQYSNAIVSSIATMHDEKEFKNNTLISLDTRCFSLFIYINNPELFLIFRTIMIVIIN